MKNQQQFKKEKHVRRNSNQNIVNEEIKLGWRTLWFSLLFFFFEVMFDLPKSSCPEELIFTSREKHIFTFREKIFCTRSHDSTSDTQVVKGDRSGHWTICCFTCFWRRGANTCAVPKECDGRSSSAKIPEGVLNLDRLSVFRKSWCEMTSTSEKSTNEKVNKITQ